MKNFSLFLFAILISCSRPEVENLGFFAQNRDSSIAGLDGFSTIALENGKTIWTFGDTILGEWKNPPSADDTFESSAVLKKMIPNSIAASINLNDSNVSGLKFNFYSINGSPAEFLKFPLSDKNIRAWPLDGIESDGRIYLFYVKIRLVSDNNNPFRILTGGISEIKINYYENMILRTESRIIREINHPGMISIGDSVIKRNGYIYIAGRRQDKAGLPRAYFARSEIRNLSELNKYEYLLQNGNWSVNFADAGTFFSPIAGEFSISYNEFLKCYIVIFMGLDGVLKSASFSDFSRAGIEKNIYTPQKLPVIEKRPFMFYYSGKEIHHSEKFTYAVFINPAVYQPVLLKIPSQILIRQDP